MSRRYIDLNGPEERRGPKKFLRNLTARRRVPPELLSEMEKDERVADSPSLFDCKDECGGASDSLGSSFDVEAPQFEPSFSRQPLKDDDVSLPSLDNNDLVLPESRKVRQEKGEGDSSSFDRFLSRTSPPRTKTRCSKVSMETSEDDEWVWPWPEFSFATESASAKDSTEDAKEPRTDSDTADTEDEQSLQDSESQVPKKVVRFADEEGKPIHTVRLRPHNEEDPEQMTTLVLLLCPKLKKFEFIHVSFNTNDGLTFTDLLEQVPDMASIPVLAEQQYIGFCRPYRSRRRELANAALMSDCDLKRDEIMVALLDGWTRKQMSQMAIPIVTDRNVMRTVRRHTRHGYRVQFLRRQDRDPEPSDRNDISDAESLESDIAVFSKNLKTMDLLSEASKHFQEVIEKEKTVSDEGETLEVEASNRDLADLGCDNSNAVKLNVQDGTDLDATRSEDDSQVDATGRDEKNIVPVLTLNVGMPSKSRELIQLQVEESSLSHNGDDEVVGPRSESTESTKSELSEIEEDCENDSSEARAHELLMTEIEEEARSDVSDGEYHVGAPLLGELESKYQRGNVELKRYVNASLFAGLLCAILRTTEKPGAASP